MRKPTALLLAILMTFSLAACGKTNVASTPDEPETSQAQSAPAAKEKAEESETEKAEESETEKAEESEIEKAEESEPEKVEESKPENAGDSNDTEPVEPAQDESTEDSANDIRPEFKEAMDNYEAFYTEYCEFMKEYSENSTDLTLIAKYAVMLTKAEKMKKAFEAWDEDELSNEELTYYLEVNNRVTKMLIDIADF